MRRTTAMLLCLLVMSLGAFAQKPRSEDLDFEIRPDPTGEALLNWSLTNNSSRAVYVYDFFLWGPAPWVERNGNRVVLSTTPTKEEATCPPNRFPPVLLLVVGPGRTIRGDFKDDELKLGPKANVSMRISVGDDPYSVVEEAKRFYNSKCKHSPYDAIVRWGTMIESNSIQIP